jgi:hypothetical protein
MDQAAVQHQGAVRALDHPAAGDRHEPGPGVAEFACSTVIPWTAPWIMTSSIRLLIVWG